MHLNTSQLIYSGHYNFYGKISAVDSSRDCAYTPTSRCRGGRQRSPCVVITYSLLSGSNMDFDEHVCEEAGLGPQAPIRRRP